MDVKQANASPELQGVIQGQLRTPFHSLLEMNSILAHYIIHHQGHWNVIHIIGECLAKTVIHINLPESWYVSNVALNISMGSGHTSLLSENPLLKQEQRTHGNKQLLQFLWHPGEAYLSLLAQWPCMCYMYLAIQWNTTWGWRICRRVVRHTWILSFPLLRWALYESGFAINAIPAESGTSFSPVLHRICSAEKFPSIMKVLISWFL